VTKKCPVTVFDKLIDKDQISEWLTAEITSHILKNENNDRPKIERPVTCPPVIYETIISTISKRMQKCTEEKNGMP
jgi:ferredoxin-like protein FixX